MNVSTQVNHTFSIRIKAQKNIFIIIFFQCFNLFIENISDLMKKINIFPCCEDMYNSSGSSSQPIHNERNSIPFCVCYFQEKKFFI